MAVARIPREITDPLERELIRAYRDAWTHLKLELALVNARVAEARAAGVVITRTWLRQQEVLESLIQQVEYRVNQISGDAVLRITNGRYLANGRGRLDAERLLRRAGVPFPRVAFERLATSERLLGYFAGEGEYTASRVRQTLAQGVLRGRNPRIVAQDVRTTLGSSLSRARTIARTELLRSYREAALDTYRENRDVVEAWEWLAEGDSCPICAELDGQRFPLEEDFETHPNCRCTCVPVTV